MHGKFHLDLSNRLVSDNTPTSIPSGILIHPAVWPQQTWAENWGRYWGAVPPPLFFWGGGIEHNVAWAEIYLPTKWHLDPCSRLVTTDMGQKLGAAVPLLLG